MSIALQTDQAGGTSLEFKDQDIPNLRKAISEMFGQVKVIEKVVIFDRIEFGGEEFIYYYEWDPCLLPTTEKGSSMLGALAKKLCDP